MIFLRNLDLLLTVEFFLSHPFQDPMGVRSSLKKKAIAFVPVTTASSIR